MPIHRRRPKPRKNEAAMKDMAVMAGMVDMVDIVIIMMDTAITMVIRRANMDT